jgi:centrosomal protein CEP104
VWTGIHSENWRVREAVAQAVLNFLEMPLPDRYQNRYIFIRYSNGKTKKLFLASMEFAKLAVEDKILQIYFLGIFYSISKSTHCRSQDPLHSSCTASLWQ